MLPLVRGEVPWQPRAGIVQQNEQDGKILLQDRTQLLRSAAPGVDSVRLVGQPMVAGVGKATALGLEWQCSL